MSDETTVQLGHQELQDHNELVEYIRKLLEKIKLLTDLYDQNLTALTEHNESESSHPDLRILLAEGNDELQNQLDSFKDDITKKTDATDKRITDNLNDFDLRLRNAVEVNNIQNDRLTALEADVALKIYDKDVSAVGHTGQFDDILNRPKITISDATNEHTGNSIRITGGNTNFVLPSTITADLKGNVTGNVKGNVTGNAATATKLAAKRTIALSGAATGTATGFDGTANIAIPVTSLDASKLTGTASVSTTGNATSATKLQTARTINGTSFNGTANITTAYWGTARNISITDGTNTSTAVSVNGSQAYSLNLPSTIKATFVGNITGNVTGNCSGSSGSCTGNAATATRANSAAKADTATNANYASNATNASAANQLQAFVNDNFTGGNHYVKAIRSSQGWSTHLWMCYNNGAKMADEVSVNYATNSGYTNWLRTSSHTDHLFHTEWDGSYFWTYVTAGDGGYRAVRVERSNSSGYADSAGTANTATTAGAVSTLVADGSVKDVVHAYMAGSDAFRIRCGGSGDNGYVEIATSDNGNEPIYVRQYYLDGGNGGDFNAIARTLTLLDGSGNTQFPGTVSAPTFSGNLNGNAATATKATFDKNGKDISSYVYSVTIAVGSDGTSALAVEYDNRTVYYHIPPVFPKKYNSVGSTILAASTTDYAGGSGNYGETVAGSALNQPYGLDNDGGQFHGSTPTCPGTWVRVSGWSGNGRTIGLWRRIA